MERRLVAILAADVVGYSRLMERDEAGTHERLKLARKELFEPEIARRHGRIFKLMGDGMLAEFASVVDAVECAVALQGGLKQRNVATAPDHRIQVRMGINLGEVIVEDDDRYGEGVNIAARLQELASPGGICVSGKVAREVDKKLELGFAPMGAQKVKNIVEPVEVFQVTLDGMPTLHRFALHPRGRWGLAAAFVAATVAVATLVAVWFTIMQPKPMAATIPSIAVLPFDDMSAEKNYGYLGDGVAEDIISMLARAPDVLVVARSSSFTYRGKATDVREIGKALGVGYVLEGSVRKEADKIRIIAQLIEASTGDHVWAERYDKVSADPWALQDEVASNIIGSLTGDRGQIKQAQYKDAWGKDTADLGEYDYYLRGHDLLMSAQSKAENDRAGQVWMEGLKKYPDSNLLKIKLAFYHWNAVWSFWSDDYDSDFRHAKAFSREVLAQPSLTPMVRRLAYWVDALISMYDRDFDRSFVEAQEAVNLAPYDAQLKSSLVDVLNAVGKYDMGLQWVADAEARDAGHKIGYEVIRGLIYRLQGNYEQSVAIYGNAGDFDPGWSYHHLSMAISLYHLGRVDEAKAAVQAALKSNPTFTQAVWRSGSVYSDPTIIDREVADLGKLGLPEK
jgi:TolB-like protein/class 3 adenylate cyclase